MAKQSVYTGKKSAGGSVQISDLVKSIAAYQRTQSIPADLKALVAELKRRV